MNNGGPAFPAVQMISGPSGDRAVQMGGMSLRDYFAAAAMQGYLAGKAIPDRRDSIELYARSAYAIADAMLAERP